MWQQILQVMITALVVIAGWFVAHRLACKREALARRRELRARELLDVLHNLGKIIHPDHQLSRDDHSVLEEAVFRIQVLGTEPEISLAKKWQQTWPTQVGRIWTGSYDPSGRTSGGSWP